MSDDFVQHNSGSAVAPPHSTTTSACLLRLQSAASASAHSPARQEHSQSRTDELTNAAVCAVSALSEHSLALAISCTNPKHNLTICADLRGLTVGSAMVPPIRPTHSIPPQSALGAWCSAIDRLWLCDSRSIACSTLSVWGWRLCESAAKRTFRYQPMRADMRAVTSKKGKADSPPVPFRSVRLRAKLHWHVSQVLREYS